MKVEAQGRSVEIEPNSKPYLMKRLIADGFDTILIFGLFLLFLFVTMRSSLAGTYNWHFGRYTAIEEETKAACGGDAAAITEALNANSEYINERFAANLHGYLLKGLAGMLAMIPVLLAAPLLNKNRATPGKLMTGLMPFHDRRQRKALWYQIFLRFLFVFLIDGLLLFLVTGIWTFVFVPVLRLIEILLSRKDKTILDMMTCITVIEKLSYSGIE